MPYTRHAYLFVSEAFDEFSVCQALKCLHTDPEQTVLTVGTRRSPVRSAAGIAVLPDLACEAIDLARASIFVLPSAPAWDDPARNRSFDALTSCMTEMLQDFDAAGVRIAANGSAIAALARAGLLDGVSHTSDSYTLLQSAVPGLPASPFHVPVDAIHDENVITARADAPAAFAREVAQAMALPEPDRARHPRAA